MRVVWAVTVDDSDCTRTDMVFADRADAQAHADRIAADPRVCWPGFVVEVEPLGVYEPGEPRPLTAYHRLTADMSLAPHGAWPPEPRVTTTQHEPHEFPDGTWPRRSEPLVATAPGPCVWVEGWDQDAVRRVYDETNARVGSLLAAGLPIPDTREETPCGCDTF